MRALALLAVPLLAAAFEAPAQGHDERCAAFVAAHCGGRPLGECFDGDGAWDKVPEHCTGDVQTMVEMEREALAQQAASATAGEIVLRGDGVATKDGRSIPFGTPADAALAAIEAAFGTPPDSRAPLDECGPGQRELASWANGFGAFLLDGKFAGWNAVDQRTDKGIGFASTRADLDAAYPGVAYEASENGVDFTVGGLAGSLESSAADAGVVDFRAGRTCLAGGG